MTDADNAVRQNQTDLKDVIVSSGVRDIIIECEEKELITSAVKSTLTSSSTNQSDDVRASELISNIRGSLKVELVAEKVLDGFLCIVHKRGHHGAKAVAEKIANEFKGCLPEYRKLSPLKIEEQPRRDVVGKKTVEKEERKLKEKDLKELKDAISTVKDWFDLGLNLDVQYSTLSDIEAMHSSKPVRCRAEVLVAWISLGNATWSKLAKALRSQNEISLAEDIEEKHL